MLKRSPKTEGNVLSGSLNELLASLQVQANSLHAAHWNIEGCHSFITFHTYTGELYDSTSAHVDKIAEYIRINGGNNPIISFTDYLEQSHVEEPQFYQTQELEAILAKALSDTEIVMSQLRSIFANTDQFPDVNDYMALMIDDYGKRIWFLKSSQKVSE